MKTLVFIVSVLLFFTVGAQGNIELQGKYVKDNKNFIYMDTDKERVKLKKSELTEEGVAQILANKEKSLIIFVPEKSIVNRKPLEGK